MSLIRLPLLITGITGVSGYNAWLYFRELFPGQVVGTRPPASDKLTGAGVTAVDVTDGSAIRSLFSHHHFGSVLHCAGNCALKACELDPAMAEAINVLGTRHVLDGCRRHGSRLVHLSSDLVYSGVGTGGYREDDPVDPVTVYGKTMARGERLVLEHAPESAVVRISLPMGPSFNRHAGAIDWIDSRFRAGRPATLYFDEVRSASYVEDMNQIYFDLLAGTHAGLFHLAGPRPITLYQIAQVVNRVGGYDPDLLHGIPRIEAGPMPPRAGNVSMSGEKLAAALGRPLGFPWPAEPELFPTDRDWHRQRPAGEWVGRDAIVGRLYRIPPR